MFFRHRRCRSSQRHPQDTHRRRRPTGRRTLRFEALEDRRMLAMFDLASAGAMATINGAIFEQISGDSSSGSGVIDSFVRLQASGTEQGYNTDGTLEFDTQGGAHTHSLQLSQLNTANIGGVEYYEFVLDINEGGGASSTVSLDRLQFFVNAAPNLTGYPGSFGTAVYDLDAGGDNWIKLDMALSGGGGGQLDMAALIPTSLFGSDLTQFVYLFSRFGDNLTSNGGFEEWSSGAGRAVLGAIRGYKFDDADGDGVDDGETRLNGVTIELVDAASDTVVATTTTADVDLNGDTLIDPASERGIYFFEAISPGTYTVREVAPAGSTQTTTSPPDILVEFGQTFLPTALATGAAGEVVVPELAFGNLADNPLIAVVKTADRDFVTAAGETIGYGYSVTNPGNVSLTNVTLADNNTDASPVFSGGDTDGDNQLDPGETWTYTAAHLVTQAEMDAGLAILNTATADSAESEPATAMESVSITQSPAIAVAKDADKSSVSAAGEFITYTYLVTNTGNISLTNVTLIDDNTDAPPSFVDGDTDGDGELDVDETWTYFAMRSVLQEDMDAGLDIVNLATADSEESDEATATEAVTVMQSPGIAVQKDADRATVSAAGEIITYTYLITNTGNISLNGITLIDDNTDSVPTYVSGDINLDGALDVDETWTYSALRTVSQDEIDAGLDIVNVATADSDESDDATATETVTITQLPAIEVAKDADKASVSAAGEVITYTYLVTNAGNVSLSGITLTDDNTDAPPSFVGGDTDGDGALDVDETWTYIATHTVTQAEMDAGLDIVNLATADSDESEESTATESVSMVQSPGIAVQKDADRSSVGAAGQIITYTYLLTNTGNVSLTSVTLMDDNTDAPPSFVDGDMDGDGELDVEETWTYTAMRTVSQEDIDAGLDIVNLATADSDESEESTATETVTVAQTPGISVAKDADKASVIAADETITYTYLVTNTGNVSLTSVTLADDNTDAQPTLVGGDTDGDNELDVDETWTYTAIRTVSQAEMDAGLDIVNLATADSDGSEESTATETVAVTQTPGISVAKDANKSSVMAAGEVITYTYLVTNVGNVSLTNVTLADDNTDAPPSFVDGDTDGDGELDVDETWTYTAMRSVLQADMDAGLDIVNLATADSDESDEANATETVTIAQSPAIAVAKDANKSSVMAAGEIITYTYLVTNVGNVSLTHVTLMDDNTDADPSFSSGDTDGDGELDLDETWTYTAAHTVTQAEMDAGADIVNLATADSEESDQATATETVMVMQLPGIAVEKDADRATVTAVGEVITYTYLVTNTGNVSLTNITLGDDNTDAAPNFTGGDTDGDGELDLDETWSYTALHTVTQSEVDAGLNIVNLATADSDESDEATATETVAITQSPAIAVAKNADKASVSAAGDVVTYTYLITNSGNVSLTDVTLTDDNTDAPPSFVDGDTDGDGELDVDETWTYAAMRTVSQADVDAGLDIVNLATADSDESEESTATETVSVVQTPGIAVQKDADRSSVGAAGQVITYTYLVTNTGNVSLTNVTLGDDNTDAPPTLLSGDTDGDGELDLDETWTYTAMHTVSQDQMDAGTDIVNLATADSDESDEATATESVSVTQRPNIAVAKEADKSAVVIAGEIITYSYLVTNTGNISLTNVTLLDDNTDAAPAFVSGDTDGDGELDVDEAWTYTAIHTVSQDQMDSGTDIVNLATADSDESDEATAMESVAVTQSPAIAVQKDADRETVTAAGEVITYTYLVTNTGNNSLSGVTLADDNTDAQPTFVSGDTDGDNELDVDETWAYTAVRTVSQLEFDADQDIVNIATADSEESDEATATETVTITQMAMIAVEKTPDRGSVSAAGQVITYTYLVTNVCEVPLSDVTLSDDNTDAQPTFVGGDTDGDNVLDLDETWTYTAVHTVTQAEMDAGTGIVNLATADSDESEPASDTASVEVEQQPEIAVAKSANLVTVTTVGQVITYTYLVTNAGNVSLSGVTLADDNTDAQPAFVSGDTDGDGELDLNETWTYTAARTVTPADLDASANIVNLATADSEESDPATDTHVVFTASVKIVMPADATNEVGVTHELVAMVLRRDQNSNFQFVPVAGVVVSAVRTNSNGATATFVDDGVDSDGDGINGNDTITDASGRAVFRFVSPTAGQTEVTVSADVEVAGKVEVDVESDGSAQDNSPLVKTWVDGRIVVKPRAGARPVGKPRRIQATVTQNDGLTAAQGGDGVNGFGPVPDGTVVSFRLRNNQAGSEFMDDGVDSDGDGINGNDALTTGGKAVVRVVSDEPGDVNIHASTTFTINPVLNRRTDDRETTPGSGVRNSRDARTAWIAPQSVFSKRMFLASAARRQDAPDAIQRRADRGASPLAAIEAPQQRLSADAAALAIASLYDDELEDSVFSPEGADAAAWESPDNNQALVDAALSFEDSWLW